MGAGRCGNMNKNSTVKVIKVVLARNSIFIVFNVQGSEREGHSGNGL
jgi:hypothetical protein